MANNRTVNSLVRPKRPLLRGIMSLFDFNGTLHNELIEEIRARYRKPLPLPSSADAIRATWQAVGDSMSSAIAEYERENGKKERE